MTDDGWFRGILRVPRACGTRYTLLILSVICHLSLILTYPVSLNKRGLFHNKAGLFLNKRGLLENKRGLLNKKQADYESNEETGDGRCGRCQREDADEMVPAVPRGFGADGAEAKSQEAAAVRRGLSGRKILHRPVSKRKETESGLPGCCTFVTAIAKQVFTNTKTKQT